MLGQNCSSASVSLCAVIVCETGRMDKEDNILIELVMEVITDTVVMVSHRIDTVVMVSHHRDTVVMVSHHRDPVAMVNHHRDKVIVVSHHRDTIAMVSHHRDTVVMVSRHRYNSHHIYIHHCKFSNVP